MQGAERVPSQEPVVLQLRQGGPYRKGVLCPESPFSASPDVCLSVATSEGCPSPKILIRLGDRISRALIDTGATKSFVKADLFALQEARPLRVRLGDGSYRETRLCATLSVEVGPVRVNHEFYALEDLPEDCVLGLDFQSLHDLWIRPSRQAIQIGDTQKSIPFIGDESSLFLLCARDVTLAPRTNRIVAVESDARSGHCYISEDLSIEGCLIPRGLYEGPPTLLSIINAQDRPKQLKRGDRLARCEAVRSPDPATRTSKAPSVLEDIPFILGDKLSSSQQSQLRALLEGYGTRLFATKSRPFGKTDIGKHSILTMPDRGPIYQRVRPTSPDEKKVVREEVQKMLDHKVIRPSSSPWASPIVLVKKKDGSVRFCIDYRKLNDITVKDVFPLPRTSDLLESFQGTKIFSTLDAAAGYWQIPLEENAVQKSAFTSSEGLFEFLVMPFGLCNAPATYQRLMNTLLAGINGITCLVYLDDIIVFSKSFEDHLVDLREVLDRLLEAEILLKPSKCRFGVDQVEYLGHIVSAEGISPDPQKVEKLKNFPPPKNLTELRSFLGFAGYYRRFIRHFAMIAEPLFLLLKEDQPFVWTKDQAGAFQALITAIQVEAVLVHPRFDQPFIVDADASGTGIGGVLSQVTDGIERPIAFISRHLSAAEQKWHIREKEALGIIWALESFRHFLQGSDFHVRTDHSSLKWLLEAKSGRLGRWALRLMEFGPFQINHRSGKEHTNVDALSRLPTPADAFPDKATFAHLSEVKELPSKEEFIKAQSQDPVCMNALKLVVKGYPRPFRLLDGVIAVDTPNGLRVYLPDSLKSQVIRLYHESSIGCHLGIGKTTRKLLEKFHLPKAKSEVTEVDE